MLLLIQAMLKSSLPDLPNLRILVHTGEVSTETMITPCFQQFLLSTFNHQPKLGYIVMEELIYKSNYLFSIFQRDDKGKVRELQ